jgi:hypothetical protein
MEGIQSLGGKVRGPLQEKQKKMIFRFGQAPPGYVITEHHYNAYLMETNQEGGTREGNFERGQGREASLLEFIFVGSEISAVFPLIIAC